MKSTNAMPLALIALIFIGLAAFHYAPPGHKESAEHYQAKLRCFEAKRADCDAIPERK